MKFCFACGAHLARNEEVCHCCGKSTKPDKTILEE